MEHKEAIDKLVTDLFNEDELGSVIRAHIRLESLLLNIVELTSPNPDYIKRLELDFDKTVTLAQLLGLIDDCAKPLRVLGKLRNDFAHEPNMKLSKSSVNNLYNTLNSEAKQQIQTFFKKTKEENETIKPYQKFSDLPPTDQFRLTVVVIWAQIHSILLILQSEKQNA